MIRINNCGILCYGIIGKKNDIIPEYRKPRGLIIKFIIH